MSDYTITEDEFRTLHNALIDLTAVCEHADVQTLAVLDGHCGQALAYSNWHANQTPEQRNLALLRALAGQQGYRLVKMPKERK